MPEKINEIFDILENEHNLDQEISQKLFQDVALAIQQKLPINGIVKNYLDDGFITENIGDIIITELEGESVDIVTSTEEVQNTVVQIQPKIVESKKDKKRKMTYEEVESLITSNANLYESIPDVSFLPTDSNKAEENFANYMLFRFVDSGASDMIFETRKKDGKVSRRIMYKIAGIQELQIEGDWEYKGSESPKGLNSFLQRVQRYVGSTGKIDVDAKSIMQDGNLSVLYRGRNYDFRLNSMPVRVYQDPYPRYCIRVASDGNNIQYDDIEMLQFMRTEYDDLIAKSIPGAIIVTGRTGSGKTTTIYAMLNQIDSEKLSVLSIEKPIESTLSGIQQTQEDTFEREGEKYNLKIGIKGCLRQALDIIFVGEMRDTEEIQETMHASMVGNTLITTFHTNSCMDTLLRLHENNISPNAIANATRAITAQRLIPALCPHCSIPDPRADRVIEEIQRPFRRCKRFLEKHIAEYFNEEYHPIDFYEVIDDIEKKFSFLKRRDIDGIIEALHVEQNTIQKLIEEKKSISKIISAITEGYPLYTERQALNEYMKKPNIRIVNPKGCKHCNEGYSRRRRAIFEFLEMDKSLKMHIQEDNVKFSEIIEFLLDRGHLTLRGYGGLCVLQGFASYHDLISYAE